MGLHDLAPIAIDQVAFRLAGRPPHCFFSEGQLAGTRSSATRPRGGILTGVLAIIILSAIGPGRTLDLAFPTTCTVEACGPLSPSLELRRFPFDPRLQRWAGLKAVLVGDVEWDLNVADLDAGPLNQSRPFDTLIRINDYPPETARSASNSRRPRPDVERAIVVDHHDVLSRATEGSEASEPLGDLTGIARRPDAASGRASRRCDPRRRSKDRPPRAAAAQHPDRRPARAGGSAAIPPGRQPRGAATS